MIFFMLTHLLVEYNVSLLLWLLVRAGYQGRYATQAVFLNKKSIRQVWVGPAFLLALGSGCGFFLGGGRIQEKIWIILMSFEI